MVQNSGTLKLQYYGASWNDPMSPWQNLRDDMVAAPFSMQSFNVGCYHQFCQCCSFKWCASVIAPDNWANVSTVRHLAHMPRDVAGVDVDTTP
jgi:hypothetical protein